MVSQSVNVFLPYKQYKELKAMAHMRDTTITGLIKEGNSLVLNKYGKDDNRSKVSFANKSKKQMCERSK